jgi:hypothetical protein
MMPPKVHNHTIQDLSDSEVDRTSNVELKRMIGMTDEIKDLYKHFNE